MPFSRLVSFGRRVLTELSSCRTGISSCISYSFPPLLSLSRADGTGGGANTLSISLSGAVVRGLREGSCCTGAGGAGGAGEVGVATGGSKALPGLARGGGICGFSCRSQVRCGPRLFFVVIEVGVAVRGGALVSE